MAVAGEEVTRASFYRSVIRSDERLSYDEVDRIFAGASRASEPWGPGLAAARAAASALASRRSGRGALEVDFTEPEFEFDGAGYVVAVRPGEQTDSHRLIDRLMMVGDL